MHDRLFVDTLFVIALINRRDQYHRQDDLEVIHLRQNIHDENIICYPLTKRS